MTFGIPDEVLGTHRRERYAVSIRYPRDYRNDPQAIAAQVLIPTADGGTVPLGQVAKVSLAQGPSSIRTENAQLAAYIFVDLRDRDLGGYVADAQRAVAAQVKFPAGYYVTWSGQFEYLERAKSRLQVVVPVTVLINGARTGGALIMLGIALLLTALLLSGSVGTLFRLFPPVILGVILFLTGAQLALGGSDFSADKGERFVTVITAALAVWNVGIAFVVGIAAYWLLRRNILRHSRTR